MSKVNIYSPLYHRFKKTKLAIESVMESVSSSVNDVELYLGVNGLEDGVDGPMHQWLQGITTEKIKVFISPKNVGKAAVINSMHTQARPCDYVISIDSDMEAVENGDYNWIDRSVEHINANQDFGVLSSFQLGGNCHVLHMQKQERNNIMFGAPGGVAGGCFIMRSNEFNAIGMYTVYDVYNGDDAYIMRKTTMDLKKQVGIMKDVRLLHIENYEDEAGYQQWKIAKAHGALPNGAGTKGYFDE